MWLQHRIYISRWSLLIIVIYAWLAGYCVGHTAELPDDPAQRVAAKALRGDFGELKPWQVKGYKLFAEGKGKRQVAWITRYWPGEPGVNHTTASGRRVDHQTAAMLDVPFGTFVLLDLPTGFNLRRVWDRGSRRNTARARARGAQVWCDLWVPRSTPWRVRNATYIRPIWVAK